MHSRLFRGLAPASRSCFRAIGGGAIGIVAVLALGSGPARAKPEIDSAWRHGDVSIDGSAEDWPEMTYIEGPDVHLGVGNDDEYLYLCLYAQDPAVGRQAMGRGLVLEIDPKGGEPLEIQFPIGFREAGGPPPRGETRDREAMRERARDSLGTFILLGPGPEDRRPVPVADARGIELRVGTETGFVYEARIPLAKTEAHPDAVGASPGGVLTLRLETPEIDRGAMRSRGGGMRGGMGGGRRGEGMPGGRGGGGPRGGPRGGGMGGRGFSRPEPLEVKARIVLAIPPPAAPAPADEDAGSR